MFDPFEPEIRGVGASPGIAIGPVEVIETQAVVLHPVEDPVLAVAAAQVRVRDRLAALADSSEASGGREAGEVLRAQSLMAADEMIADAVEEQLQSGLEFNEAFDAASARLAELLASVSDPYLAARSIDVGDVMSAVKRELANIEASGSLLTEPSILIAKEFTAAQTASLDPNMVLGFATTSGGATSHVSIVARSLGVPAVVGVDGLLDGAIRSAVLDGSTGEFVADPTPMVVEEFEVRRRAAEALMQRVSGVQGSRVQFAGRSIDVTANVSSSADINRAVIAESDGVGLFRTEFLFLDTSVPPDEDAQYDIYRAAAQAWPEDTVVIRTFDIGGDKTVDYLDLREDESTVLGHRGVRLYSQFPELIDSQLRAALRAAAHGSVAVMVPMVATLDEFFAVRKRVEEQRSALMAQGYNVGEIELGVMVEVPSVALMAETFAEHVDFFSIGTNDLTQYTMAADRRLGDLTELHDPLHPAVLGLCKLVAEAGSARAKSVSVCGQAASDPLAAAIFGALGVTKLSVAATSVNLVKATLDAQPVELVEQVDRVLATAVSAAEVRQRLEPFLGRP